MATLPANDLGKSELDNLPVVEEIVMIETALIDAGPRLRLVDEVWAGALGDLILREGQRDAIDVCRASNGRFRLAGAGGHRLRAAQLRDIEGLKARIWPDDAVGAELREIQESLHRRDLEPYERATFVAAAVSCVKRKAGIDPNKDGRAASAQARWQKVLSGEAEDATGIVTVAYGWATEVANALGYSKASIEKDLLLHRRLSPEIVRKLQAARHPVLKNGTQLRTLAKLEPAEQARVVDQLVDAAAPAKTVSDAQARLRGANKLPSDPEAKRLSAFLGNFQRMGIAEKKGALSELLPLLPAGTVLSNVEGKSPRASDAQRQHYEAQVIDGLKAAFHLLLRLSDGDEVDDDEVNSARFKTQMAIMSANSGFIPDPVDTSATVAVVSEPVRAATEATVAAAADTKANLALVSEAKTSVDDVASEDATDPLTVAALQGDLRACVQWVSDTFLDGGDAEKVLLLTQNFGGRHRFANGTYELRLAKVTATCTAGAHGLIHNWLLAARRRLEKEAASA